jgi:hypothetical protein
MKEEICKECSGIIGLAEQAYVYEGRIVCEQCDKKLRQEDRQDWKSPDAEDTWLNQESEELLESLEVQEHKEILEFQQPQESKGPQEARELEGFEELKEPKGPKESPERKELLEFQEARESTELQGPKAGPVEAEEGADVPDVPAAKPLSPKRKRVSTTESTLLPLLLAAWSLLCVFLLFYVPGRYVSMLQINAFGYEDRTVRIAVECLILFFMVFWFFGALGLYVVIIGYDKDEKTNEKLRTLRLLGF